MLASIARGALVAAVIAIILALPRAIDLPTPLWVALLALAHLALPFAAAFGARRPDVLSFDASLAALGVVYIGLLALSPNASGWLYGGVPFGYALYAFLATLGFIGLAKWRTALRVRGIARLRSEARRGGNAALG